MKTGIELIADERKEQIEKHGFDSNHDKKFKRGSLSYHAAILATPTILYEKYDSAVNKISFIVAEPFDNWKLPNQNFNGNEVIDNELLPKEQRIKQLVVAGALIAAEIDRLNNIPTSL
jgi:hypothetical protein